MILATTVLATGQHLQYGLELGPLRAIFLRAAKQHSLGTPQDPKSHACLRSCGEWKAYRDLCLNRDVCIRLRACVNRRSETDNDHRKMGPFPHPMPDSSSEQGRSKISRTTQVKALASSEEPQACHENLSYVLVQEGSHVSSTPECAVWGSHPARPLTGCR